MSSANMIGSKMLGALCSSLTYIKKFKKDAKTESWEAPKMISDSFFIYFVAGYYQFMVH